MTNKILFLFFIILSVSSTVFAQKQAVYVCSKSPDINKSLFENAIQKTISKDKSIDFLTENTPCSHSKAIKSNLNQTINKNLFNLISNHSFSLIKIEEDFFSIEQFVFKTEKQANLVSQILAKRTNNMLQTPGTTFYDYFLSRNSLIFYIANQQVYKNNLPFFQNFKHNFLMEHKQ